MFRICASAGLPGEKFSSFLFSSIAIPFLCISSPSLAASKNIDFTGQLDYATFQQAARANETVTIRQSPGGSGASALALARVSKVIVDGPCNSACAWSFVRNENACFTPRASFGFHAAHDPGTGQRLNAATSYWLSSVRPDLRKRLGGLLTSSSLIRLSAPQMRSYYGDRACGSKPNIQIASNTVSLKRKADGAENRKPSRNALPTTSTALAPIPATDVALQVGALNPDRLSHEVPPEFVALAVPDFALSAVRMVPTSVTVTELGSSMATDRHAHPRSQILKTDPKAAAPIQIADEPKKIEYGPSLGILIDPKDVKFGIAAMPGYLRALSDHAKKVVAGRVDVANLIAKVSLVTSHRTNTHDSSVPAFPAPSIFVELCAITPRRRSPTDLSHMS